MDTNQTLADASAQIEETLLMLREWVMGDRAISIMVIADQLAKARKNLTWVGEKGFEGAKDFELLEDTLGNIHGWIQGKKAIASEELPIEVDAAIKCWRRIQKTLSRLIRRRSQ